MSPKDVYCVVGHLQLLKYYLPPEFHSEIDDLIERFADYAREKGYIQNEN